MTVDQFDRLLRTSLELWGSKARLQATADAPLQARLALPDGLHLTVHAAADDEAPFRWWLLWHGPDAAGGSNGEGLLRRKPCASTLGLLRTLRESLGVPAAAKVRIGSGAGRGADL